MKILIIILLIFCLILSALYVYNAYAAKTNKEAIDKYIKYQMSKEQDKHIIKLDKKDIKKENIDLKEEQTKSIKTTYVFEY